MTVPLSHVGEGTSRWFLHPCTWTNKRRNIHFKGTLGLKEMHSLYPNFKKGTFVNEGEFFFSEGSLLLFFSKVYRGGHMTLVPLVPTPLYFVK